MPQCNNLTITWPEICENKVLAVNQNEHFLSVYEFKSGLNWYIDKGGQGFILTPVCMCCLPVCRPINLHLKRFRS